MVIIHGRRILEAYATNGVEEHDLLKPFGNRFLPQTRKTVYWREEGQTLPSWQNVNAFGEWPSGVSDDIFYKELDIFYEEEEEELDIFYEELYEYARNLQDHTRNLQDHTRNLQDHKEKKEIPR